MLPLTGLAFRSKGAVGGHRCAQSLGGTAVLQCCPTTMMNTFKAIVISAIVLAIGVGLMLERRGKRRLNDQIVFLKSEVQQLTEQVASQQQEHARFLTSGVQTTAAAPVPDDQHAELRRLRAEVGQLRDKTIQLEAASAAISNQIASATGANTPFIYSDSVRRKDYAFSGYAAPQSALHSMFWALSQSDPQAYQASVTSQTAEMFANAIKDLPEGVMPGGYKNGALYRASGYRIMEETPISDDETRVKVFLEGRQNLVLKLVFKKVGDEWKMARTEF